MRSIIPAVILLAVACPLQAKVRLTSGHLSDSSPLKFRAHLYDVISLDAPDTSIRKDVGNIGFGKRTSSSSSLQISFPNNKKNLRFECSFSLGYDDTFVTVRYRKPDGGVTDPVSASIEEAPDRNNPGLSWKFTVDRSPYRLETIVEIGRVSNAAVQWNFKYCDISKR